MSQAPLSAEYMFRKIEALEAALTFAIASISVQMPAVKTDVLDGLKQMPADLITQSLLRQHLTSLLH
ncbi:hypothetical protein ACP3P6_10565 [Enterobacter mori]